MSNVIGDVGAVSTPMPTDGIAYDMLRFLIALERGGKGFAVTHTTKGNSIDVPILATFNYLCPSITLVNHGSVSVNWGYNSANQELEAGSSITLQWKNPVANALVINDLGNAGVVIGING